MSLTEFLPSFKGKPIHELPDGATGYKSRSAEQALNEMTDGGVVITEAEDFMRAIPQTFSFPQVCNPLDYLKVKSQLDKGACAGFTVAQIGEMTYWVKTGGKIERFSGDAMYVLAQEKDGIKGDRGSTPTGCAWVLQNIGLVPESLYGPTVQTYQELKPVTDRMREAAGDYKLKSIVRIKTYEQAYQFLGSGLGALQICSKWQAHFMESNIIESFHGPAHDSRHAGGHSFTGNGYDNNGNILCTNSWDVSVHDEGGFLMTPQCFRELLADSFSFVLGYSDMATSQAGPPKPRRIPIEADGWT